MQQATEKMLHKQGVVVNLGHVTYCNHAYDLIVKLKVPI